MVLISPHERSRSTRLSSQRALGNAIVAAVSRVRTYGDTRYRSNNSCWETSHRPMQSACLRPIAVSRHERSGTVTLSCVYRELSPCSPACTMTFASDWPWRMTYRSNGMPMVAPPELVDCRTDIDQIRTGRADPSRFHRSRTTARPGTFLRWACTEFTGGTCRVHLRHRDRADGPWPNRTPECLHGAEPREPAIPARCRPGHWRCGIRAASRPYGP